VPQFEGVRKPYTSTGGSSGDSPGWVISQVIRQSLLVDISLAPGHTPHLLCFSKRVAGVDDGGVDLDIERRQHSDCGTAINVEKEVEEDCVLRLLLDNSDWEEQ